MNAMGDRMLRRREVLEMGLSDYLLGELKRKKKLLPVRLNGTRGKFYYRLSDVCAVMGK